MLRAVPGLEFPEDGGAGRGERGLVIPPAFPAGPHSPWEGEGVVSPLSQAPGL